MKKVLSEKGSANYFLISIISIFPIVLLSDQFATFGNNNYQSTEKLQQVVNSEALAKQIEIAVNANRGRVLDLNPELKSCEDNLEVCQEDEGPLLLNGLDGKALSTLEDDSINASVVLDADGSVCDFINTNNERDCSGKIFVKWKRVCRNSIHTENGTFECPNNNYKIVIFGLPEKKYLNTRFAPTSGKRDFVFLRFARDL